MLRESRPGGICGRSWCSSSQCDPDIEEYLNLYPADWSRVSVWKRVSQFLKYFAKRKLIATFLAELA